MIKNDVIKKIDTAFDGVTVPADKTLYQAEAWDSYEKIDQSKDHKGRWQDLPKKHIDDCRFATPHLTRDGVMYYLPAFMTYILNGFDADENLVESIIFNLQESDVASLIEYQDERLGALTDQQKRAIKTFLNFMKTHDKKEDEVDAEFFDEALNSKYLEVA